MRTLPFTAPLLALLVLTGCERPAPAAPAPWPEWLSELARFEEGAAPPTLLPFAPQYPLWTDGAAKRRWIELPEGEAIDATDPAAWRFPVGSRFYKELAFDGRPVETRVIEALPDGGWRYATYIWEAGGEDARRCAVGRSVSTGGGAHWVPAEAECQACHEGRPTPVLGFELLQLSPDRDPLAPHAEPPPPGAVDLRSLVSRGLLRGLPAELAAPRIEARSPTERAALGYLHGNCGHCHTDAGPLAPVGLVLLQAPGGGERVLASTVGHPSQFRSDAAAGAVERVAPGDPAASILALRMRTRDPLQQMPPLGTARVDAEALALVERWIAELPRAPAADAGP